VCEKKEKNIVTEGGEKKKKERLKYVYV